MKESSYINRGRSVLESISKDRQTLCPCLPTSHIFITSFSVRSLASIILNAFTD